MIWKTKNGDIHIISQLLLVGLVIVLVLSSSNLVFAMDNNHRESHDYSPVGKSKCEGEKIIISPSNRGQVKHVHSFDFANLDTACIKSHAYGFSWFSTSNPSSLGGDPKYSGWVFMDYQDWLKNSDSGDRRSFTLADGIIAIADPDEWWDITAKRVNKFDSTLYSPLIAVPDDSTALNLSFFSHYQQDGNQKRALTLTTYDKQLIKLHTMDLPVEMRDSKNQVMLFNKHFGDNAVYVRLEWRVYDAQNDWYWTIDNPKVMFLQTKGIDTDQSITTFSEISTIKNIDEKREYVNEKWGRVPPLNWSIVNMPVTLYGSEEFSGWTFMDKDAWIRASGDQDRSKFRLGEGFVAIADPDEWDDFNHDGIYHFDSKLASPIYNIPDGDRYVFVHFSNHFKQSGNQKGSLSVEYYDANGNPLTSITSDRIYKTTKLNSEERYLSQVPYSATHFTVNWRMYDAQNDWYWAIDNVYISTDFKRDVHTDNFEDLREDLPSYSASTTDRWSVKNHHMPSGDANFQGWHMMDGTNDWINKASGQHQGRDLFKKSTDNLLVADPDEWNDGLVKSDRGAVFDSKLYSPLYTIPAGAVKAHLEFNSHYRGAEGQYGELHVLGERKYSGLFAHPATGNEYDPTILERFETTEYNKQKSYLIDLKGFGSNVHGNPEIGFVWHLYSEGNTRYWAIDDFSLFFSSEPFMHRIPISTDKDSWDIIKNGGDKWKFADPTIGLYIASYAWDKKSQTIDAPSDLIEALAQSNSQVQITLTEKYSKVYCGDTTSESSVLFGGNDQYYLKLSALDSNGTILYEDSTGNINITGSCTQDHNWQDASVSISASDLKEYAPRVVYLQIEHGGISAENWKGHWGPAMKDAELSWYTLSNK